MSCLVHNLNWGRKRGQIKRHRRHLCGSVWLILRKKNKKRPALKNDQHGNPGLLGGQIHGYMELGWLILKMVGHIYMCLLGSMKWFLHLGISLTSRIIFLKAQRSFLYRVDLFCISRGSSNLCRYLAERCICIFPQGMEICPWVCAQPVSASLCFRFPQIPGVCQQGPQNGIGPLIKLVRQLFIQLPLDLWM